MQTHECWTSPMWGHQINSLMTKRWEIEVPPEPRDMTAILVAANAKRQEQASAVKRAITEYLVHHIGSAEQISYAINRDIGWTRKLLGSMDNVTYEKEMNTKVWRLK